MNKVRGMIAVGLAVAAWCAAPDAEAYRWLGETYYDGTYDFENGDYWRNRATGPVEGSGVIFNQSGYSGVPIPSGSIFTVKLNENTDTLGFMYFYGGETPYEITLDLNGYTLDTRSSTDSNTFRVNAGAGDGAVVNMTSGAAGGTALLTRGGGAALIGAAAGTCTLNLLGNNLTVHVGRWYVAQEVNSTATLHIASGAQSTLSAISQVGGVTNSHGTLRISGASSRLTSSNTFYMGRSGNADLVIEQGGEWQHVTAHQVIFGSPTSAKLNEGHVVTGLVTGSNSVLRTSHASSDILVGGDTSAAAVTVTVADQGLLQAGRNLWVQNIAEDVTATSVLAVDGGTVKVLGSAAGQGLFLRGRAKLDLTLHRADRDALIQVAGDILLQSDVELLLELGAGATFQPFEDFVALLEYGGTLHDGAEGVGRFSNYSQDEVVYLGDYVFQFDYAYQPDSEGPSYIGLHVIPEPGSLALLALAAGGLLAIRRRQRSIS